MYKPDGYLIHEHGHIQRIKILGNKYDRENKNERFYCHT